DEETKLWAVALLNKAFKCVDAVDLSVYFNGLECSNVDLSNPLTYKEAIEAPDRLDWESAMNDEDEETKLWAVALLNKAFKCVDLGRTKRFLGIDIIRESRGIRFSQKSYIEGLFERFKKFGFKNVKEPFKVGMDLHDLNCEGDVLDTNEYPYRTLVGILMFISRYTRPDICVAINILARYNSAPKLIHWTCILNLWNYVISTKEKCIHLSKSLGLDVNCYVDASWATSVKDRKSITGYLICAGKNPIIW
uniref:Reverse transcriptase Ty1/copia-type domain-containing protein n=1 Tax=Strigamia maritima TaxID=126957 RepID=T1IIM8_STRMM